MPKGTNRASGATGYPRNSKEVAYEVKRIMVLMAVALMMVAMVLVMAAPVFAAPPTQADKGLIKAFDKSGGKSHPPSPPCITILC